MELVMASRANFQAGVGVFTHPPRCFKKLRVSITDHCNLACVYCDSQKVKLESCEKTDLESLLNIVKKLHLELNLSSVRITGGEPVLHHHLTDFIFGLKKAGIPEVNLTTNGIYLEPQIENLLEAGLNRINISLDALDESIFSKITGNSGAGRVMSSIIAAKKAGFKVKINSIIMRSINENQILPLLEFAIGNGILIRFLELMKMGQSDLLHHDHFYPQKEILSQIQSRYQTEALPHEWTSTAHYYQIAGQKTFGIIANYSEPFCESCDRLRLDSRGNLYGCLSNPTSFPMQHLEYNQYNMILKRAMSLKQTKTFTGSALSMRHIGG